MAKRLCGADPVASWLCQPCKPAFALERLEFSGGLKCLDNEMWTSLWINLLVTLVIHADLGKPGTPIWVSGRGLSTPIWVSRTPIWVRKYADLGKLCFRKCLSDNAVSDFLLTAIVFLGYQHWYELVVGRKADPRRHRMVGPTGRMAIHRSVRSSR